MPACTLVCVSRGSAAEQGWWGQSRTLHEAGSRRMHCRALCQPIHIFTTPIARLGLPESLNNQLYPAHELMEVKKER